MSRPAFTQGIGGQTPLGMTPASSPGNAGGSNLIKIETVP